MRSHSKCPKVGPIIIDTNTYQLIMKYSLELMANNIILLTDTVILFISAVKSSQLNKVVALKRADWVSF